MSAQEHAAALTDSIEVLSQKGEFESATRLARVLLVFVESDSSSRPYQIADADYQISRLEHIAGLPGSVQQVMASVERDWGESSRFVEEDKWGQADSLVKAILPKVRTHMGSTFDDEARCLHRLGEIASNWGHYDEAEAYFRDAAESLDAARGKENSLYPLYLADLGEVIGFSNGRWAEGAACLQEAHAISTRVYGAHDYRTTQMKSSLSQIQNLLGEDVDWATVGRENIKAHREQLGETAKTAVILGNNAAGAVWRGEFDVAESYYQEALSIFRKTVGPEHNQTAWCLRLYGALKISRGDYDAGEAMVREALRIHRAVWGDVSEGVAFDLWRCAQVPYLRGDYVEAERLARECVEVCTAIFGPEQPVTATAKTFLGKTLLAMEQFDEAQKLFAEAVAIREKEEVNLGMASYLGQARASMARGDYEQAESLCKRALAGLTSYGGDNNPGAIRAHVLLARIHVAQGNISAAEEVLDDATRRYEIARRRISTETSGRTSYAAADSPYPVLASVKLRFGKDREAWVAAESDRGRALLDVLAERDARELSPEELVEEQRLEDELVRLAGVLEILEADSTAQALAEADSMQNVHLDMQSQWASFQMRMREKYPVTEGRAYSLERLQSHLDPMSGIIGWLDTDEGSYAYLVLPGGNVRWARLSETGQSVAAEFYAALVATSDGVLGVPKELARRAYEEYMGPFASKLESLHHLYVIPSGEMLGIPVEALMSDERSYVIDRWRVTYAPSATVLGWIKDKPASHAAASFFAIGDPPFNPEQAREMDDGASIAEVATVTRGDGLDPVYRAAGAGNREAISKLRRLGGTRQEVESISHLFETTEVLLGRDASEQRVLNCIARDGLDRYRYIHLATHAIPNATRGMESALVLSQIDLPDALTSALEGERIVDGRLTMEEVAREWDIDADLVTLSACETALGQRKRGEGYVGFAHTFLLVGARTVVVSLWKVADRPTRLLMERFYANLLVNDMPKSEALREAKLWLRDLENQRGETPYAHPFYWSSFVLIGDPG